MDLIHTTNPLTRKPCGGTFQIMTRAELARIHIGQYREQYRTQTMSDSYYVCDRCGIGCDYLVEDEGDRERAKKAATAVK